MAYGGVGVRAGPAVALSRERAKCPPAAGWWRCAAPVRTAPRRGRPAMTTIPGWDLPDPYRKPRRCSSLLSSLLGRKSTGCPPVIGPMPEPHSNLSQHHERRPTAKPVPICSQPVHLPKCRQRSGPHGPRQRCIGPHRRSRIPAQCHGQCSAHSARRCTVIRMRFRRVPTPQRSIRKPPQVSR
jgi:hypothetical protein